LVDSILSGYPTNAASDQIHTVEIVATDSHGGRDTLEFDLEIANAAPVLDTIFISPSPDSIRGETIYIKEAQTYSIDIDVDDEGQGTNTAYVKNAMPAWLSFIDQDSCQLRGTPGNDDIGTDSLKVTFDDGNGESIQITRYFEVRNEAPSIQTSTLITAIEDSAYTDTVKVYPYSQGDYTFSITGGSASAWLIIDSTGILNGTPNNSHVGQSMDVTIKVDDGHEGGTDTKHFFFDVENRQPVFTVIDTITIIEDDSITGVNFQTDDEGFAGTEGDSGYVLLQRPDWLSINPGTGELSGTPNDSDVGDTTITVKYSDGNGESNSVKTMDVILIVENNPPTFTTTDPPETATEDIEYSYTLRTDDDEWGVSFDTLYACR
ncbi:MAG: putative Ig domain-containing protein, partial [Candidatus Eisenbacteria sp.]|nr:putative Ig domain-containing protein [Candidatus Eisenbacteria bacterium]